MKEKDVQSKLTKWLKKYGKTGAYELKICKGKSLLFNAVKEHQVNFLVKAQDDRHVHKLSDFSPGLKPYDCFCLEKEKGYVVIAFWEPRNLRTYMINISDFIDMKDSSSRKSITETMAAAAGEYIKL